MTNTSHIRLNAGQRIELKRLVREAFRIGVSSDQMEAISHALGVTMNQPLPNVSAISKDGLLSIAAILGITIPDAQVSAAQAFDDDLDDEQGSLPVLDTAPQAKTSQPAPRPVLDVEATIQDVLAPLGKGDFASFQTKVRDLATKAATPIEVVRTETVIEEKTVYVNVPAPPPGCGPSHIPTRTATKPAKDVFPGLTGPIATLPTTIWDAPDAPHVDDSYIWPASTGAILSQLRRGRNVMLVGPAGTGKTSFAYQLAARTKRPLVVVNCHEQTDAPTLTGMTVPRNGGEWQDGQLTAAIRRPGTVILVDEPSIARPGALFVLQSVLQDRVLYIEETGERVPVADGVVFLLADNTGGVGDQTGAYEGTRRLNRASLDRMGITVPFDYMPEADEVKALAARAKCKPALATLAVRYAAKTRMDTAQGRLTHALGLRRLIAWCELVTDGIDPAEAYTLAIDTTAPHDDREVLRQLYRTSVNEGEAMTASR
jgi:cobaltochelatase CobS